MTNLVYARRPFGSDVVTRVMPPGLTLAAMIEQLDELPPTWRDDFVVTIDGRPVPAEIWDSRRVGEREIVTVSLDLGGGGTLKVFAQVAVLAAAVAANFLPGGQFISAGIMIGGQLAINALFRPPRQALAGSGDQGGSLAQASLSTNVLAKGRPLPRVAGWRRIHPPAITFSLTELVGEVEVTEAVCALAGPHQWRNVRTGEQVVSEITDVETETREGRPGEEPLSLIQRYGREDVVNIVMSEHRYNRDSAAQLENQTDPSSSIPTQHRVTSRVNGRGIADEIWLTYWWQEGLFDDDDPTAERGMAIRSRIRRLGASTWINLPELHVRWKRAQAFRLMQKLIWGTPPSPLPTPPTTGGFTHAFVEVPAVAAPLTEHGNGWQAHSHFDNGVGFTNVKNVALYSDRAEIFLDADLFPRGVYEIESIHSAPIRTGSFTVSTYVYNGAVRDLFGYRMSGASAILEFSLAGEHQKVNLHRVASVVNENPAPLGGDALLAFKGRNRAFEQLSAEAAGLVPTYDASAAEWSGLSVTTDPEAHMRYALTGPLTADPALPIDLADDAAFVAFRQRCIDEGFELNAVFEAQSLWDAVTTMAAAGNGEPRASDKWGVIWEYDRTAETPVQMFTPRNARGVSFRKAMELRPDAIIASYADALNNYADRQVVIYDDGVTVDDPSLRFEERRYDWLVSDFAVIARARLELRMERLRDTLYEMEVGFDGRFLKRGDFIAAQNEVWNRDTGSAVVKTVTIDGGLVTGLVLDAEVPVFDEDLLNDVANLKLVENVRLLGRSSAVRIRLADGTLLQKAIDGPTGEFATIVFTTGFVMPTADFGSGAENNLVAGCLVSAGIVDLEYRRVLVSGITGRSDTSLTLNFLDEKPEIHAVPEFGGYSDSMSFNLAGTYQFVVPAHTHLRVTLWGAGGSGGSTETTGAAGIDGVAGTDTTFDAGGANEVVAGGGGGGGADYDIPEAGGAGGVATGGDVNTNGEAGGSSATAANFDPSSGYGGACLGPGGGARVDSIFDDGNTDGNPGNSLSGGGSGATTNNSEIGGGGGGGAYAQKVFTFGVVASGTEIEIVVGAPGVSEMANRQGGGGTLGRVTIEWGV